VSVDGSSVGDLGEIDWQQPSEVHFIQLQLRDASGKLLSQNFYWHRLQAGAASFDALAGMAKVTLEAQAVRADAAGSTVIDVTLRNPGTHIALMTHLQLRRAGTGDRVLPASYSDNYISLAGGESRTITIAVKTEALHGENAAVLLDGLNVAIEPVQSAGVSVDLNRNAQADQWPETGLPFQVREVQP
jgi:beta-mannosidase